MPLIQTAEERAAQQTGVKLVVLGPSGIGKTSLVWSLPPAETLVIDMEAGMLALEGWTGASTTLRDWETARNIACWIAGPNPAKRPDQPYSQAHYGYVCQLYGDPAVELAPYRNIFWDSITQLARLAFQWAKGQPEAFSEKTGKPDNRGAYGLLGQEMVALLSHVQHCPNKNIILVGILDQVADDYGKKHWVPQIDGGKAKNELQGIVDELISMVEMKLEDGTPYRAFVCQTLNPFGYPAKDRSGRLEIIEEPHLGKLIAKMKDAPRNSTMTTTIPEGPPAGAHQAHVSPTGAPEPVEAPAVAAQQQHQPWLAGGGQAAQPPLQAPKGDLTDDIPF